MGSTSPQGWPLIVSYYTEDEVYAPAADRLRKSLEKFSIPYCIAGIERDGDIIHHMLIKIDYIETVSKKFIGQPFVWMDADNEILREPVLFRKVALHDLSIVRFDRWEYELNASVIGFGNNGKTDSIITAWRRGLRDIQGEDQPGLHRAVQKMSMMGDISIAMLPLSYAAKDRDGVIMQHHASIKGGELWPLVA